MNQYRCETCKNCSKNPNDDNFCLIMNDEIDFTNFEHTAKVGCASHSNFQSERDKVLDAVFASMDTFFGNIPMDSHIIQWAISKQDSFVTAAMATYLESRKLRQAGEP